MSTKSENPPPQDERRGFFSKLAAVFVGGLVGLVPIGAGVATLLDPLFRKSKSGTFLKVASLDAVPADGIPRRFPVIADRRDAWNYYPNQPVGSIYLRRQPGQDRVEAYNAACPHVGCLVSFNQEAGDEGLFQCPCHMSDFLPDGVRVAGDKSPSPRDLDTLEVDQSRLKQGEIWVDYKTFKTNTAEKVPIE